MTTQNLDALVTQDSVLVQEHLRPHFERVEVYRYNAASIRVRIVDRQFHGLPKLQRIDRVEELLDQLPDAVQEDIVFVLCLAPGDETKPVFAALNREFESPEVEPASSEVS